MKLAAAAAVTGDHHRLILRVVLGTLFIAAFIMLATSPIPHSPSHHHFADMRNTLGVPNTLNVITSFPLLVIGAPGLVFCLSGSCFGISLKWEAWAWAFFYAGILAAAFGSSFYHLRPDDDRILWDRLPMMIAVTSLLAVLVIERVDERVGISCWFSLVVLVLLCIAYERNFDDLRLCIIFHLIPFVAIPVMVSLLPPKYTHSRYWFWAIGFYLLSRVGASTDKQIYSTSRYLISGHSVEHLCLAMVPVMLTVMLWFRSIKIAREA